MTNADPPFSGPALPESPNDLAWLAELVRVAADEPISRAQVVDYLGQPTGVDSFNPSRQLVRAHSPFLAKVTIYPLPHIRIDLAVDLEFAEGSRPGRSAMASALGPLAPMARAPDDFHSGQKLSLYRRGKHGTARVFVELDPKNDTQVRSVHVDVDGVARE